jgi:hypothetical protein
VEGPTPNNAPTMFDQNIITNSSSGYHALCNSYTKGATFHLRNQFSISRESDHVPGGGSGELGKGSLTTQVVTFDWTTDCDPEWVEVCVDRYGNVYCEWVDGKLVSYI